MSHGPITGGCQCTRCGECHGSGRVWVDNPDIYPEEELDTCPSCDGTGNSEICQACEDWEEMQIERP